MLKNSTKAEGHYYRIESGGLSAEQQKLIGLDKASASSIKQLKVLGKKIGENHTSKNPNKAQIDSFFTHPKQYLTHSL